MRVARTGSLRRTAPLLERVRLLVASLSKRELILDSAKLVDDGRVVHAATAGSDDVEGFLAGQSPPVRPARSERVEAIHDGQDPRAKRNCIAAETIWVT